MVGFHMIYVHEYCQHFNENCIPFSLMECLRIRGLIYDYEYSLMLILHFNQKYNFILMTIIVRFYIYITLFYGLFHMFIISLVCSGNQCCQHYCFGMTLLLYSVTHYMHYDITMDNDFNNDVAMVTHMTSQCPYISRNLISYVLLCQIARLLSS